MDPVRRVVVRDKHPLVEPDILLRPLNRAALLAAAISLALQVVALRQLIANTRTDALLIDHLSFAGVSFLWLALGVLVFLQRRRRRTGQLFLLAASVGSVFLSFTPLYFLSLGDALVFAAGLLLFAPLLLSFVLAFDERRAWRRAELLFFVIPLALLWPTAQDFVQGTPTHLVWRFAVVTMTLYLIAAIGQAARDLRAADSPYHAAQARALLAGLLAGTAPGVILFTIPILTTGHVSTSFSWLPSLILLFVVAMSYASLLFEFAEADLIVRRGIVYAVITLVIVAMYAVVDLTLWKGRIPVTSLGGGLSFVTITILVGIAFTPTVRAGRRFVDWLLYGQHSDRWETLQALSSRLEAVMQPDELGEVLTREIRHALNLRGAFLLRRQPDESFVLQHSVGVAAQAYANPQPLAAHVIEAALGEPPASLLLIHAKPLSPRQRERVPEHYRPLDDLDAALSVPLQTRSGLEAVLCLQSKLGHDAFTSDDLELLTPVIHQASAALGNALLFVQLQEKIDEVRAAYVRIAHEQEMERARLARELHDGTAQELASLITLATVVERQLGSEEVPAKLTLERLRLQAEDAYQGVRRASHALRPLMLDDFGLVPTLARYFGQFESGTGIEVEFTPDETGPLTSDVELALFRVAQECMENVRKHSGAQTVCIALRRTGKRVTLTVSDSGRGMPQGLSQGIGLAGMRERVEAVGGEIRVTSNPERGVHVEVAVPVS